jgi:hypothetical protein
LHRTIVKQDLAAIGAVRQNQGVPNCPEMLGLAAFLDF